MKVLIKGGHVVDPASALDERQLDVLVVDGRVAKLGKNLKEAADEIVGARDRVVCPGFIDIHVHLREPGREQAETIATGARAAAAGGFTAIACMPNTEPINDDPSITRFILRQAAAAVGVRVYPIAAATRGSLGKALTEYGLLKEAGAVAVSDDGRPIASSEVMRRALEYAGQLGLVVVDHCEDATLSPDWAMNEGEVATRLGLLGMSPAGEEIQLVRNAILARFTGSRTHAAHLSTRGAVERLKLEKARGVAITGEVTPHHFCLTQEAVSGYDTNAKMNPPLRGDDDRAAVLTALADGTIDCIASDHAPHHRDVKMVEFGAAANGVIGLETTVSLTLDRLLHAGVIGLTRVVELLSSGPARVLGLPGGTLSVGSPGDVTILDLEHRVEVVPEKLCSLSRNTPFAGWKLRGAAVLTMVGGRTLWSMERGFEA